MTEKLNQADATFETIRVAVDAGAVSARVAGNGTPLVLFHSLLADGSSFDPVATMLAQTHRVVILNLPGFGESDAAEGGLEQVAVPVLVGEFDEATPPDMSRELAAGLPYATLQILPGCAHVPQLQEPAQFLAAVKTFIAL